MGVIGLAIRRARAGFGLLLTILVLAAGTTAIIAGTLGYSEAAATTAARQSLTDAAPTEAGIRVQTRLAEDPTAQDAAAEQIIREAFAPTEVLIQRTIVAEPRRIEGVSERLIVMAGPALTTGGEGFADRVTVTEGSWPTAAPGDATAGTGVQGALHAGAAELLGVGAGDQLDVAGTLVEVTALWLPVDADAAFWFDSPLAESGVDKDQVGPLVVAESDAASFGSTPFVQFTVQPDAQKVLPADMPRLAAVAGHLDTALRTPEVEVRGVTVEGDLAPTAEAASSNLATARALNLVPVTLLLLVSLIALVQIARLQAQARAGEVELLIARGASRGQVLAWSILEAVVVAVLAAALGTLAALGVMQLVPAGDLQSALVVRTGVLAGVAVLLALVIVAVLQVRALAARTATDRSGRTRTVAALGTVVLTVGAAAIAWWQLHRYGSPLVTNADGTLRTDLVAGAAPALLLAAAAVLSTMVLGPLGRFVETLSRRSRGLLTHLVSAQVSRRLVVYAVPVVLTVLAVGATTVSGLYAGTSAHLRESLTALGRGADIRAVTIAGPDSPTTLATIPTLSGTPGVEASAPVWLANGRAASSVATVTVLPVQQLGQAVSVPEGVMDVPAVVAALQGPTGSEAMIPLPQDATSLDLTVEVTAAPQDVEGLQADLDQTWDWTFEQFGPEYTENPPPPEEVEAEARRQVDYVMNGLMRPQEMSTVLWFWDESSSSLLRVEAPPIEFDFDVELTEGPKAPTVSLAPSSSTATVQVPVTAGGGRSLIGVDLGLPQQGRLYDFEFALSGLTTSTAGEGGGEGEGADGTNLMASEALATWQTPIPTEARIAENEPVRTSGTLHGGADGLVLTGVTGREEVNSFGPGTVTVVSLSAPGFGANEAGDDAVVGEVGTSETSDPATSDSDASSDDASGGVAPVPGGVAPVPGGDAPATPTPGAVPVAITHTLAETGNFEVGMPITLQVFGGNIPATIASMVTAVPGSTDPNGVLIDSAALSQFRARTGDTLGAPTQLWASSNDESNTLAAVQSLPGIASASATGSVAVTDAASAVRLVFWVASAGAILLAVTGIAAVAANLLRTRRAEVSVLRALGMTPGGQASARAAELFFVVLASLGLGLLAGWLVGALVVPELARSTTLAGQAQLPAPLLLEIPLWAGLLVGLLVAFLLLIVVLHATVRRQGLDNEYREEIR